MREAKYLSFDVAYKTVETDSLSNGLTVDNLVCPSTLLMSRSFLDGALTLHYAVVVSGADNNGILCARMEYEGLGFIGFGISRSGGMVGSEAIIGLPDDGTVLKYNLGGKNTTFVTPMANQTLLDTSIVQTDTTTIMSFTKLLREPGEKEIYANGKGENTFLYAASTNGNALGYHGSQRSSFSLSLLVNAVPYYVMKIGNSIRAVVEEVSFQDANLVVNISDTYEICGTPKAPANNRGEFSILLDESCKRMENRNPLIDFDGFEHLLPFVLENPGSFEVIDEHITGNGGEEYILPVGSQDASCANIPVITEADATPVFAKLPDGTWLMHDPRLVLEENTLENPIFDGGGTAVIETDETVLCSNAPRTFLNEDHCVLSNEFSTCGVSPPPVTNLLLEDENIITLTNLTQRYVYAIKGLRVVDMFGNAVPHPCTPGQVSRWEKTLGACSEPSVLGSTTMMTLMELLMRNSASDSNAYMTDIDMPNSMMDMDMMGMCNTTDLDNVEIQIDVMIDMMEMCFTHVHPDHLSIYDMTYWTEEDAHPGNMIAAMEGEYNPIKKWHDIDNSPFLVFPRDHPREPLNDHSQTRWDNNHKKFEYIGRYGDTVRYRDLHRNLRIPAVAEHYGAIGTSEGTGMFVCGGRNEVSNDPALGTFGKMEGHHGFDITQDEDRDTSSDAVFESQKHVVWTSIVLSAADSLRQRMAFALSQILVVVKGQVEAADRNTEIFLNYYDIFVEHAFGNYRDALREVSYSPMMSENLSFLASKSAAFTWDADRRVGFADENFAREIMQLFSIGFYLLNTDGSQILDPATGAPLRTYTNFHIASFARVWTGFERQDQRGNTEDFSGAFNRMDPSKIIADWRDKFPKSSLYGGYLGDGTPLCVDLPEKMFLRKGARYRLLGSISLPELIYDHPNFKDDDTIKRLELPSDSLL